jgi:hypothetical protein
MSNYLEEKLIKNIFKNTAYTPPTTLYVALYTSDPTDADVGVECSYAGYARVISTFTSPIDGVVKNVENLAFAPIPTASQTITHIGIRDALTFGNLLFHAPFSKVLTINQILNFPVNSLSISLT